MHLFLNAKKGVSGLQLQIEISVTYKTARRILHQIRLAMGNKGNTEFIETIIEVDEAYVGGKPLKKNEGRYGSTNKRGRGTDKIPVVGVMNRNDKQVHVKVATRNGAGLSLTCGQLPKIINEVATQKGNNTFITDEFKGYNALDRKNYKRIRVDQTVMFCDGEKHTNTIESLCSAPLNSSHL